MPDGFSTPQLLASPTREINERTGNVYENKEQGQNVMASADLGQFPIWKLPCALGQSDETRVRITLR
jgi:hypothetical protein